MFGKARWIGLALLVFVPLLGCSSDGDSEEIAGELADRLTDALAFEGGTVKAGDPPAANEGDEAYPQTTEAATPGKLTKNQSFTVTLHSNFVEVDKVVGAIIHVDGSSKYIEISQDPENLAGARADDTLIMNLLGELLDDAELFGESFDIMVALLDTDGNVGNYWPWGLEVEEGGSETDGDEETAPVTTFSSDISPIVSNSCWNCHNPDNPSAGFVATYANMVDIPATQTTAWPRVTPDKPEESYVWHKLNGTHGPDDVGEGEGMQMPVEFRGDGFAYDPLPEGEKDTFEQWIKDGAEEGGGSNVTDGDLDDDEDASITDGDSDGDSDGDTDAVIVDGDMDSESVDREVEMVDGDAEVPSAPTYYPDVDPIIQSECVSCHYPGLPSAGLDINFVNLVGAASTQVAEMYRVDPGNPNNSYMWLKLNDTHLGVDGGSGTGMPSDGGSTYLPLSGELLIVIENWINGGALEGEAVGK